MHRTLREFEETSEDNRMNHYGNSQTCSIIHAKLIICGAARATERLFVLWQDDPSRQVVEVSAAAEM